MSNPAYVAHEAARNVIHYCLLARDAQEAVQLRDFRSEISTAAWQLHDALPDVSWLFSAGNHGDVDGEPNAHEAILSVVHEVMWTEPRRDDDPESTRQFLLDNLPDDDTLNRLFVLSQQEFARAWASLTSGDENKREQNGNEPTENSPLKLPPQGDLLDLWKRLADGQCSGKKDREIAREFCGRIENGDAKTVGEKYLDRLKTMRTRREISDWRQR